MNKDLEKVVTVVKTAAKNPVVGMSVAGVVAVAVIAGALWKSAHSDKVIEAAVDTAVATVSDL